MPRHRVRAKTATVSGGGGGSSAPTFTISETEQRSDKLVLNPLRLVDSIARADTTFKLNPLKLTDSIARLDAYQIPNISLTPTDTIFRRNEVFNATVDWRATARSGTPNTDPWGDGWVDSLLANQGVNHGNESPLPIDGALLAATQNDAFMEVDLTRFTGFTAPTGGTMTFTVHAVQLLAVAQTFSAVFSKFASRPFLENDPSGLDYTSRPADGSDTVSKSVSVLVGTVPDDYAMVLTAAEYGPFLGSWMMVRFSSTAVLATPINISSREDATVSQRPNILFNITR